LDSFFPLPLDHFDAIKVINRWHVIFVFCATFFAPIEFPL
jgi:hypothetical protein